jgi:hypothetical protein
VRAGKSVGAPTPRGTGTVGSAMTSRQMGTALRASKAMGRRGR